ncbi:hypothetical protein [Glycomyces tenuis]|uniref:hypothetical protein n=1 Tax=Glycomyces tenuis TaxID=58116 RepID=UPI000419E35D|nr:hypothetical protein [Glycomyces tenuis]
MKQLRHAIEDYLYGLNAELDLPLEAAHALVRGLTSPSLAELAGLSTDATYEIRELLPMVTEELSIEVAPLPDAVLRKACETAAEYRVGTLGFRSAASRVTALLLDNEYLMFEKRPDMASTVFNDLWRLNEWLYATERGHLNDSTYFFTTSKEAEAYFRDVVQALTS